VYDRHQTLDDAELVVDNLARGVRQFVMHEALETMSMSDVYFTSLTPNTNMGASAERAVLRTTLEVHGGFSFGGEDTLYNRYV